MVPQIDIEPIRSAIKRHVDLLALTSKPSLEKRNVDHKNPGDLTEFLTHWFAIVAELTNQRRLFFQTLSQTELPPDDTTLQYAQFEFETAVYRVLPSDFARLIRLYWELSAVLLFHAEAVHFSLACLDDLEDNAVACSPSACITSWAQQCWATKGHSESGMGTSDSGSNSDSDSGSNFEGHSAFPNQHLFTDWAAQLDLPDYLSLVYNCKVTARALYDTGLQQFGQGPLHQLLVDLIQHRLKTRAQSDFETPHFSMLLQWMQSTLLPWLAAVTHSAEPSVAAQWEPLLTDQLYQRFGDLRIGELFNIIVEYPDSLPAVEDLRTCLGRIGGKMDAAIALRADVEKRLLQQGANTQDILTQYVSCVKCLRVLDPTSVMAHFVTAPIRTYLRGREDTIKCIVASLVGDDNSVFDDADLTMVTQDADSDDEDNNFDREDWEPEPMDALAIPKSPSQRHADIIGILTNIYDTKDVFAKEYQRILADKLLRDGQASVDNSIKNLELLKLRFGETNIWICEVMVKDITDSKRISQFVHDQGSADGSATAVEQIGMDALVLSHLFWPTFRKETFALPPIVQQAQAEYGELYSRLKPARALHWLPHLGTVDLTIELANRTLDLTVTPLQAAIIHCFSETTTWSLVDLAERLEMALPAVQSKLAYWLAQGVIHEKTTDPLVYEATETSAVATATDQLRIHHAGGPRNSHQADAPHSNGYASDSEDFSEDSDREEVEVEAASAVESGQDRRVEEMRIYWSFVVGMLTNLGSLPLDRIQAMLHMFVQEPAAYSRSEAELRDFLNLMVKEDKLELSAGMYKLK